MDFDEAPLREESAATDPKVVPLQVKRIVSPAMGEAKTDWIFRYVTST